MALLVGPAWTAKPSLAFDGGVILNVSGFGSTAVYAGLTWNVGGVGRTGRLPTHLDGVASSQIEDPE